MLKGEEQGTVSQGPVGCREGLGIYSACDGQLCAGHQREKLCMLQGKHSRNSHCFY